MASRVNIERTPVYMIIPPLTSTNVHEKWPCKSWALKATNIGWTTQPAVRSVTANEHRRTFEGVWRDRVLSIAAITGKFCTVAVKQNMQFNTSIATLVGYMENRLTGLSMMNEQWNELFSISVNILLLWRLRSEGALRGSWTIYFNKKNSRSLCPRLFYVSSLWAL